MDSNDALFVAEAEVDQKLRARNRGGASKTRVLHDQPTKSGDSSLALHGDNEDVPLLSDGGSSRRDSIESDNESSPPEWFGTVELQGLPWWNRPSIFWLLPPFLLSTIAFGGIVVPKLNLILTLICKDYYADKSIDSGPMALGDKSSRCRTDEVSSRVSLFLLYGSLCSGLLSAITSPKLGALSDRYGRKKILALTTCGMLVGEILTILAAKYPESVDLNWILVGYALDGLCGSFIVGMALAHSYATDCTPPQKRNIAFAYFHACLFTGIAIGPILAGYIIKKTGSVLLVFYIALVCHLIFIIFLLFCIPESLSKSRQEAAREKHRQEMERLGPASDWINQLRTVNLFRPLKILYPTGPGSSPAVRRNLLLLAATDTVVFSVAMGAMGVTVIYLNIQFGWDDYESSKYVSIVNSCRVFCLMAVLPAITRLVRGKEGTYRQRNSGSDRFDLYVIRVAIFFDMLGYLGFSLSRDGRLFILSGAVASIGGIGSPTLGSALTKHVPPDRTGQLLGATGLLHAFARVIGPTIFNGIYSATVSKFRQTVFVCLAGTFGLAFVCSWLVKPHVYLEDFEPDGFPRTGTTPVEEDGIVG
ncbi:tetracycline-efflux transporter-like protein [Lindgomyces ingoldianus]|uniref:Tetracycline-efflux transporter-like protein n=1 Tax=Lindgomyces ingoldianus TaxID=673940 RepID=A0ACB6RFT5_9PLEO|nr:tetracycline-efflux transporter-like protein [Lindgomyces ingoldianus]KAF2477580.1 tetracycline-efflux transporter-like protein [Lindgomyces ingoldianus]